MTGGEGPSHPLQRRGLLAVGARMGLAGGLDKLRQGLWHHFGALAPVRAD